MHRRKFITIASVILLLIIVGIGKYILAPKQESMSCDGDVNSRLNIITAFTNAWKDFESKIPYRPILGSTVWGVPYDYQFLGNNRMLIAFEDGHIALASVIQYQCGENGVEKFSSIETFTKEYPFSDAAWNRLYERYGDKNFGVHSYTKSTFKDGELIQHSNWIEVPENIFVRHSR